MGKADRVIRAVAKMKKAGYNDRRIVKELGVSKEVVAEALRKIPK